MESTRGSGDVSAAVELWLDPVCPFSWNTARWLIDVADEYGFDITWHLMNLSALNEGLTLSAPQQDRMRDSRHVGRLMTAISTELGQSGLVAAYLAFGARYFDDGAPADEQLAARILDIAGARTTTTAALFDEGLDAVVRRAHAASQLALGMPGGSPMLTINGATFFGPVLTSVPESTTRRAVFDAIATLASTPQFSQLQRPRAEQAGH